MKEVKLINIETEDSKTLYFRTEFSVHSISILVSDGLNSWSGNLENAKTADFTKIREALNGHETDNFIYSFSEQNSEAELSFKVCLSDTVKRKLGSIKLVSVDPKESVQSILSWSIQRMKVLENEAESAKNTAKNKSEELEDCYKKLEECVQGKEDNEKFLFAQFSALLNAKKDKIRHLKSLTNDIAAGDTQATAGRSGYSKVTQSSTARSNDEDDEFNFEDSPVVAGPSKRSVMRRKVDTTKNQKDVQQDRPPVIKRVKKVVQLQDTNELIDELM